MHGSGPSMLNAMKLVLHDWQCFGPCLLTFLMAWAALYCLFSFSKKCHQVGERLQVSPSQGALQDMGLGAGGDSHVPLNGA